MTTLFQVLFEDNHLLVVEKPPGVLSQGDRTGDLSMVDLGKAYLKSKYDKPGEVYLGLVHRLDRPTGGVLLLARTSKAAARLSEQFQKRTVEKRYLALCEGVAGSGAAECVHYLCFDEATKRSTAYDKPRDGAQRAVLRYRSLAHRDGRSFLQVELLTGRKHQIRAQLSTLGLPLVGDRKYSGRRSGGEIVRELGLWAYQLRFFHPVKREPMVFRSLPSPDARPLWSEFADELSKL